MAITSTNTTTALPNRSAGSAIQGYIYQFDQTILRVLAANTGTIVVEGLEDIDVHDDGGSKATQVKYLESSHYATPATLRAPILLMLDAFSKGADYDFILHVYFGDGSQPPTSFTIEQLHECLTEHKRKPSPHTVLHYEKYTEQVLASFVARLTIRQGLARDEQLEQVIAELASALGCNVDDVSELHYGNALKHVQDLAMGKIAADRRVKRADFLSVIDKRRTLYTRWHKEVIGNDRYVAALAKRIKTSTNLRSNRLKALELKVSDDATLMQDTADIVEHLAIKAYGVGKLTTTKVWTIILDGAAEHIQTLKLELLSRGIKFEDGFEELEFQPELFGRPPVVNANTSSITKTSYDVRVISIGNLQTLIDAGHQFDISVLTTEANRDLLMHSSKYDPVELLGLERGYVKKVLEEVTK